MGVLPTVCFVSPGLMPRPSLSARPPDGFAELVASRQSVAGVDAPAFVERADSVTIEGAFPEHARVAGVDAPAFVERRS